LPDFPVNGHGSLVPAVPLADGLAWVTGSSFERDSTSTQLRAEDERHNFSKLKTLLPAAGRALANQFDSGQVQGWAGVRCATPSRLPSVGALKGLPDLWLCSGLGSRGLTFAALCAELLAARLHGEPLPVAQRQADALLPQYSACAQASEKQEI
jgi:tRNA 5-methylaminomethyl-2-thiouridine biosynthesis bifunctional protein